MSPAARSKPADHNLRVTKLVVVDSLRSTDSPTALEFAQEVSDALVAHGTLLSVQVLKCHNRDGFRNLLRALQQEVERGEHFPVLHIECHGEDEAGLELVDGSMIPWLELCEWLRPLNEAMQVGLITVVSACFGASFISSVSLKNPSPCLALVGPSKGVWGSELHAGLKNFYVDLTGRAAVDDAIDNLLHFPLENGSFIVITARFWFTSLMVKYLEENATTPAAIRQVALRQYQLAKADGRGHVAIGDLKRAYLNNLPKICREYHSEFFMTRTVPRAASRYADVLNLLNKMLAERGFRQ